MSHEVTHRANGTAEMAYVGETPWWEGGNRLDPGQSIEAWKTAAGMDWRIASAPVQYTVNGSTLTADSRVVLYRDDNHLPLGVVSPSYLPVHPGETLEFFRDLTEGAGFHMETAGTLFGGKRLWALASIGSEATIADPRDKVKGYLLLSTACDGSMSTEARYTSIRVVCNNTLGFARNRNRANVKVTHRTTFDPRAVKQELGIEAARTQFDDAMAQFRQLSETRMRPADVVEKTGELFVNGYSGMSHADRVKALGKPSGPVVAVGTLALDNKAMGSEFTGTAGTAWGWLNAVTQYVDHEARAKNSDTRTSSAWYGRGAEIKQRALEMAVEMIGADGRTIHTVRTVEAQPDHSILLNDILTASPALV